MVKSRQEIKEYAKQAFRAQRKPAILGMFLAFLPLIALGILALAIMIPMYVAIFTGYAAVMGVFSFIGIGFFVVWFLGLGVGYFLFPVLNINLKGLFIKVFYGQPINHLEPYADLKINYGRKLGGFWWQALWLYIWSLVAIPAMYAIAFFVLIATTLLTDPFMDTATAIALINITVFASMGVAFIPIIIKYLAYCMSSHILAVHPNVTAINALNLSKRMTKGYRGKIFVMWLSFLGWHILNVLTLGILGVFFVGPYLYTTMAGYFIELRNTAVSNGTIHPSEFEGFVPYSGDYPQNAQYQQYGQSPPPAQYPPQ
jgi:uncharacterized membrane protein